MPYSYDRRAATKNGTPTYKGKPLKLLGSYQGPVDGVEGENTWFLEGHGVLLTARSKHGGWEVSIQMTNRRVLPGTVHGKDLETVIDGVIKNEMSAIKGAEMRLEQAKKSLESLGK